MVFVGLSTADAACGLARGEAVRAPPPANNPTIATRKSLVNDLLLKRLWVLRDRLLSILAPTRGPHGTWWSCRAADLHHASRSCNGFVRHSRLTGTLCQR